MRQIKYNYIHWQTFHQFVLKTKPGMFLAKPTVAMNALITKLTI
jgi:hypothetical protein